MTQVLSYDVKNLTDSKREALAWKVRSLSDVKFPVIRGWNDQPCRQHKRGWEDTFLDEAGEPVKRTVIGKPKPGCRQCGIILRAHQRVGAVWLYLKKRALLADSVGTGKTLNVAGLIGLMIETGELAPPSDGGKGGVIIVPRSPALRQWESELKRVMPGLQVAVADTTKQKRAALYMTDWQVLLIGPETFRNDYKSLMRFPRAALITDDVDPLRNDETDTSIALDYVGARTPRYNILTGTPLQKRLPEVYCTVDEIGGRETWKSLDSFNKLYVKYEFEDTLDSKGQTKKKARVAGYKNMGHFKAQLAPMVLRRTAKDLDDVTLPVISASDVWLDLHPAQRAKYKELQANIIRLIKESGETEVKHVTALSKLHYSAGITAGLSSLKGYEDGPGMSVKFDRLMQDLDEELDGEKAVVFVNLKSNVRALQARFRQNGIGFTTIWGEETNKQKRLESQHRFWDDPNCRILLGTRAIEQSLNLQVSRHLLNVDQILNPARMEQLAGRVRRQGSQYSQVYVRNYLTIDTHEERYMRAMEKESALAGHVWNDQSELYRPLTSKEVLQFITG